MDMTETELRKYAEAGAEHQLLTIFKAFKELRQPQRVAALLAQATPTLKASTTQPVQKRPAVVATAVKKPVRKMSAQGRRNQRAGVRRYWRNYKLAKAKADRAER